jgi:hypothetical protein
MSKMFLQQVEKHLDQLKSKLSSTGKDVEIELAQTRQFLSSTKDRVWKNQLLKRIKKLEAEKKTVGDTKEVNERYLMVKALHERIASHPEYNKTRKKRAK